jgi:phosphoribosylanthranilate isomerase|tara:strand:+ start:1699 stop:2379 length:681 start_codon:yes stop_codon:yes gene_type:complete
MEPSTLIHSTIRPKALQTRTRIKVCGITNFSEALLIAQHGADSLGLVFHPKSPRFIGLDAARKIRDAMPPFVTITALFMDETEEWIEQVLSTINPDCLQFHGDESEADCVRWKQPYIKSISMGSAVNVEAYAAQYPSAQGFLFDSNVVGLQGGSGDTFDWSKIPLSFDRPLLLAGGLNPSNVADAVTQVRPWCVDVSSGVEISKGLKDLNLINQFFQEVVRGDANT